MFHPWTLWPGQCQGPMAVTCISSVIFPCRLLMLQGNPLAAASGPATGSTSSLSPWQSLSSPPWQQKIISQQVKGYSRYKTPSPLALQPGLVAILFLQLWPRGCLLRAEMCEPRNAAWFGEAEHVQKLHSKHWSRSPRGAGSAGKSNSVRPCIFSHSLGVISWPWRPGNGKDTGQDKGQGNMLYMTLNFQE